MKLNNFKALYILPVLTLFLSGCYTQLQVAERYPGTAERIETDRGVYGQAALADRSGEIISEEDYSLGYEDGWVDAELYYFKDYEARDWYANIGSVIAHTPRARNAATIHYHYYGFHPYYYDHIAYYRYPYSRHFGPHFGFNFHWGWGSPYYAHGYYAYPGYYPYYGFYWGSHRPYYGYYHNQYVYVNRRSAENYGPRTSALSSRSRGNALTRTTRSASSVSNNATRTRSSVRTDSRTRQVESSRGTVNRSRSTTRNSGNLNRGSTGSNSSRGTVNRSSSGSRSSGTVNRSRSTARSSGTVNSSRSTSRSSSGTASRSRNNNPAPEISSLLQREGEAENRTSARQSVYSSVTDRNALTSTRRAIPTSQQRSVELIRSRVNSTTETVNRTPVRSASRSTGQGTFARQAARAILGVSGSSSGNTRSSGLLDRVTNTANRSATVRSGSSSRSSSVSTIRSSSTSNSRSSSSSGTTRTRNSNR